MTRQSPTVTENVVWTSPVRVAVAGNGITKNTGCDGCWDAGAASQQTIASGDGAVQFTASNAYLSVGLSTGNPGTTADQKKRWFVHDGGQVALQFEATGTAAPNLTHRYFWGLGTDELLAGQHVGGSSAGIYWALTDHLGTVRDLVDNSGTVRMHAAYDSIGNVVSEEF